MAKMSSQQVCELLLQAEQRLEETPTTVAPSDNALVKPEAITPVAAAVPNGKEGSVRIAKNEKTSDTKSKVGYICSFPTSLPL